MKGRHTHEWRYGEPMRSAYLDKDNVETGYTMTVYRFCTKCLKGEEILLKDLQD